MRRPTIGYVYVIKFADGIVKAGRTASPSSRIQNGGYGSRKISEFWVSDRMADSHTMERKILSAIKAISSGVIGREYFKGIGFHEAVEVAKQECDKHKRIFDQDCIDETMARYDAKSTAMANTVLETLSSAERTNQDNTSIGCGLTAIRNAVFYSSLGIDERLDFVSEEVFSIESCAGAEDRIGNMLNVIDSCRSALCLMAKAMTDEVSREELAELYQYAMKSKAMLEDSKGGELTSFGSEGVEL